MRTRNEIASAIEGADDGRQEQQIFIREILNVLLDIRDLLANPPKEITGEPTLHAPEVEK